ncbi:MAG: tyrosine-type recombinase/integrase [Pseudomonadota bacterium]
MSLLLLPADFRYLESADDFTPIPEVLGFLRETCISGRHRLELESSASNARYAYDLCDFLSYLDHRGKRISDITNDLVDDWVDTMDGELSARGGVFAPETIRSRLSTICQFAIYAQRKGLLANRLESRAGLSRGKHFETLVLARRTLQLKPDDADVRPIPNDDLKELLDGMGPLLLDATGIPCAANVRRLIGELGLQSGLRRAETVRLRLKHVCALELKDLDPLSKRALRVKGKGRKWRNVPTPVWLLRLLQEYAAQERSRAVARLNSDHGYLFVHGEEHPRAGQQISPKAINVWFAASRKAALDRHAHDLSRRLRLSRHTFHCLRHTFALLTYVMRKAHGDDNPGKHVQALLGHSSQQTTDRIYLRASHTLEAEISEALQGTMLGWAA